MMILHWLTFLGHPVPAALSGAPSATPVPGFRAFTWKPLRMTIRVWHRDSMPPESEP